MAPPSGRAGHGLYDPTYEHDACGVAFVARLGAPGFPRGDLACAVGARAPRAPRRRGGGRGHRRRRRHPGPAPGRACCAPRSGFELPEAGRYGVAMCFLPERRVRPRARRAADRARPSRPRASAVLGWRDVPIDAAHCGTHRRAPCAAAASASCSSAPADGVEDQDALERSLYVIRRVVERAELPGLSIASFSSRTLVYKGMLTAPQLSQYYPRPAGRALRRAAWRSCTRASRPTPSRAGSSPTRTGCSPTTARSTRCAATATGCARASCTLVLAAVRRRHRQDPRRCCATTSPTRPRSTA